MILWYKIMGKRTKNKHEVVHGGYWVCGEVKRGSPKLSTLRGYEHDLIWGRVFADVTTCYRLYMCVSPNSYAEVDAMPLVVCRPPGCHLRNCDGPGL